jgi:hypothetical protein
MRRGVMTLRGYMQRHNLTPGCIYSCKMDFPLQTTTESKIYPQHSAAFIHDSGLHDCKVEHKDLIPFCDWQPRDFSAERVDSPLHRAARSLHILLIQINGKSWFKQITAAVDLLFWCLFQRKVKALRCITQQIITTHNSPVNLAKSEEK